MSFLGTFEAKVDGQGRIIVPQRFRDAVQNGLVLAQGFEGCINAYPPAEWDVVTQKVRSLDMFDRAARDIRRHFYAGAFNAKVDGQGRVVVPENLRGYADLREDIIIAGNDNYFEVWSASRWGEQKEKAGDPADLADKLVKKP